MSKERNFEYIKERYKRYFRTPKLNTQRQKKKPKMKNKLDNRILDTTEKSTNEPKTQ